MFVPDDLDSATTLYGVRTGVLGGDESVSVGDNTVMRQTIEYQGLSFQVHSHRTSLVCTSAIDRDCPPISQHTTHSRERATVVRTVACVRGSRPHHVRAKTPRRHTRLEGARGQRPSGPDARVCGHATGAAPPYDPPYDLVRAETCEK